MITVPSAGKAPGGKSMVVYMTNNPQSPPRTKWATTDCHLINSEIATATVTGRSAEPNRLKLVIRPATKVITARITCSVSGSSNGLVSVTISSGNMPVAKPNPMKNPAASIAMITANQIMISRRIKFPNRRKNHSPCPAIIMASNTRRSVFLSRSDSDLSCPHAARMSRPLGVRMGEAYPLALMKSANVSICSQSEHS